MRVAVVGAGPSGFYASAALLAVERPTVTVDLYDRLPTPYGLVRAGVAPDHPKIKSVIAQYEKVAAHERFRFCGHVDVGREVSRTDLLERYHAVVWAIGAAGDRRMGIAGEDLRGSYAATDFVAWYNGHPDFASLEFDLRKASRVAVIGNGNVALDIARMIALDPHELAVTDVADHALSVLSEAAVREIVVIGRRGPAQAAFTSPELRELGDLDCAQVIIDPRDLEPDAATARSLEGPHGTSRRRNLELMADLARRPTRPKHLRIIFRFFQSPVALLGGDRVQAIRVERNTPVVAEDGSVGTRGTGVTEELAVDVVFRAIGSYGVPVAGLPFDQARRTIRNVAGRVVDDRGTPLPGEYVAGWAKRGPVGVIGTNKKCAKETVGHVLDDMASGRVNVPRREDINALIASQAPNAVSWTGWEAIDAAERAAGQPRRRPRAKLTSWEALRAAAGTG